MCITSYKPLKARKARKDIIVYKLFKIITYNENNPKNVIITGPYYNDVTYSLGNLHVMSREDFRETLTLPILAKGTFSEHILYQTANGLYSFGDMKQVRKLFEERSDITFSKNIQYKAYKCIIPKGTMYIKKGGEYVSTHLYVTSEEIQLN